MRKSLYFTKTWHSRSTCLLPLSFSVRCCLLAEMLDSAVAQQALFLDLGLMLFLVLSSPLQVAEMSESVGSALIQKGFKAGPETFVGIFAQNRPEVLTTGPRPYVVLRVLSSKSWSEFTPPAAGDQICDLISTENMTLCYTLESDTRETPNQSLLSL